MDEKTISSSENRLTNIHYGSFFDNKHIIMLLIDSVTRKFLDASPAACAFYGYSREEMLMLSVRDINILTDEQIIEEVKMAKSEARNHFFFQHRLSNGEIRFVEVRNTPIKIKEREFIYSIVNDITEQKNEKDKIVNFNIELEKIVAERTIALEEANALLEEEISEHLNTEERLQKTFEELEDIYNNSPCGYHSLDKEGMFLRINDTMLTWLGYSREEIIGKKNIRDIMTSDSVKVFSKNFPEFKKSQWLKDLELEFICRDGRILTVLLSATAVADKNGNYIMSRSSSYDITEHRKIKDELRVVNSRLEAMVVERTNQLQDMNASRLS